MMIKCNRGIRWVAALVAGLMLAAAVPVFASEAQTAQEKFDALKQAGIFDGFPDGSAGLNRSTTREQAAKVMTLLLQLPIEQHSLSSFRDVADDAWSLAYIAAVEAAGIMEGYGGGIFGPHDLVTEEQLAAIVIRALGLGAASSGEETNNVDGEVSAWAARYVAEALKHGLIPESVDYTSIATRGMLVHVVYEGHLYEETRREQTEKGYTLDSYEQIVRSASIMLTGTLAGGTLKVNGNAIQADGDGRWKATVNLLPGENIVKLEVNSAEGSTSTDTLRIVYDTAPTLEPISDQYGYLRQYVQLQARGADKDGDNLMYTASGLPDGVHINGTTGLIMGVLFQPGVYNVAVTVTETGKGEAGRTASQSFVWTVSASDAPSPPPDRTPPTFVIWPTAPVAAGTAFEAAINEQGWIYAVPSSMISLEEPDVAALDAWAGSGHALKISANAHAAVEINTEELTNWPADEDLYLYAVDRAGNLSSRITVHAASAEPDLKIVKVEWSNGSWEDDEETLPVEHHIFIPLSVTTNKAGMIYVIHMSIMSFEPAELTQQYLDAAWEDVESAGWITAVTAEAGQVTQIDTSVLQQDGNEYYVIAVDELGNVIVWQRSIQLIVPV